MLKDPANFNKIKGSFFKAFEIENTTKNKQPINHRLLNILF